MSNFYVNSKPPLDPQTDNSLIKDGTFRLRDRNVNLKILLTKKVRSSSRDEILGSISQHEGEEDTRYTSTDLGNLKNTQEHWELFSRAWRISGLGASLWGSKTKSLVLQRNLFWI